MKTVKSPAELGFTKQDRHRLKHAMKRVADARTYRRLQAVFLVATGYTVREAAQSTDVDPVSIYYWVRRYLRAHRVEDLVDALKSGRPRVVCFFMPTRWAPPWMLRLPTTP